MATVQQEIQAALRMNRLLGPGQTEPGSHLTTAIEILNVMLSSWGSEGINVPAEQSNTFNVTANNGQYTVGSGGDFNMARPASISKANLLRDNVETELYKLSDREYQEWPTKNYTGWPFAWYYRNQAPLGTFIVIHVPDQTFQVVLYTPVRFASYSAGSTTVELPDGYDEAIRFNLGLRLYAEYRSEMPPDVLEYVRSEARRTKGVIQRLNYRKPTVRNDFGGEDWDRTTLLPGSGGGTTESDVRLISVSGTADGVNRVFTLSPTPSVPTSLDLYVDGVARLQGSHYTLSGSTVTFDPAATPPNGAQIWGFARV